MRWVLFLELSIATPWISTHTCGSTIELAFSVLIFGSCCADIIWNAKGKDVCISFSNRDFPQTIDAMDSA